MKGFRVLWLLSAAALGGVTTATLLLPTTAGAQQTLEVRDPVASQGEAVAAVYLTVQSADADTLVGVSTDIAIASMHRTEVVDGIARMRRADRLAVPASVGLRFAPGGNHIMLQDLERPLNVGDRLDLRLRFERAGERVVSVAVVSDAAIASLETTPEVSAPNRVGGGGESSDVRLIAAVVSLAFVLGGGGLMWRFGMRKTETT